MEIEDEAGSCKIVASSTWVQQVFFMKIWSLFYFHWIVNHVTLGCHSWMWLVGEIFSSLSEFLDAQADVWVTHSYHQLENFDDPDISNSQINWLTCHGVEWGQTSGVATPREAIFVALSIKKIFRLFSWMWIHVYQKKPTQPKVKCAVWWNKT